MATSTGMVHVKLRLKSVRSVAKYVISLKCVDPSLSTIANTSQIIKSARFSGTRKVHMVGDGGEVLETMQGENIPWIDYMHIQSENTTTYSAKAYSKVHNVHKTRSHQAFTRVQLFPINKDG